jgi:hypothetical protein
MIATTADGVSSFIALVNKTQNLTHTSFNATYKHLEHLDKKPKLATTEDEDEDDVITSEESNNKKNSEDSSSSSDDNDSDEKSSE